MSSEAREFAGPAGNRRADTLCGSRASTPHLVRIFDTTLRDGEQSPGCSMTVAEKVQMARKLEELAVDVIEAGFPVASQGDFEAVRAVGRACEQPCVAGLARCRAGDIRRAAHALETAQRPRIHVFIASSEIHLVHKLRMTRAHALEEAVASVELARRYVDEVEFSAEDASRTTPDFLEAMATAVVEAGADTFNIPDTVGYALPEEFAALVRRVVRAVGERAVVSVHCHDDLGLAVANSLAAVEAGARQVECTINGIGERAGNCALEEVVMALRVRHDRLPFDTAIRTDRLFSASETLSAIVGFTPQPNKAIVGRNAFAHEAGIHQDGVIKHRSTYEIMDPATVGVPEGRLVLGKHSGRHALQRRCEALGFVLDADQLECLYRAFVAFADRKKGVVDEEIVTLIQHGAGYEQLHAEVQRP